MYTLNYYYLTGNLTKVQKAVAEHFDCPNVEYFPLEVSGGQGSAMYHWEATFMGYDFMTA